MGRRFARLLTVDDLHELTKDIPPHYADVQQREAVLRENFQGRHGIRRILSNAYRQSFLVTSEHELPRSVRDVILAIAGPDASVEWEFAPHHPDCKCKNT